MEKFVIRSKQKHDNFSIENYIILYNIIEQKSKKCDIENKNEKWKHISEEWKLEKYDDNNTIEKCGCDIDSNIIISNQIHKLNICKNCVNLFPNIYKVYANIDKIINNIIDDVIYEKINYDILLNFSNGCYKLDHNTVDKYNKDGCKNKRNIKIYKMLSSIGQYHHKHYEFQEKLHNIYTKICRHVDSKEIYDKVNDSLSKIQSCNKCDPLNQCLSCFKNNNKHLVGITSEQIKVLWKVYRHIFNDSKLKYGLYGSAGTGKTTLIKYILQINNFANMLMVKNLKELLNFDLKNVVIDDEILTKYNNDKKINTTLVNILNGEKVIVLASPTNKALDVIREKVNSIEGFVLEDNFTGNINNLKIIFFTISKLLTYHRFLDNNHNIYFKRGQKYVNIIDKYDLVIIDESSMINENNINDINSDINTKDEHCNGFILFTGDKAQLPPPKENFSGVFRLEMNKTELQTVMRTDKEKIIQLSNLIRKWIFEEKDNMRKELLLFECNYINFFSSDDKFIDRYIDITNSSVKDAIILVWTNNTKDKYNKIARNILFKNDSSKERFLVGEHLIFNDFYKIKTKCDEKVFYSSMPIVIRNIKINNVFMCEKYSPEIIFDKINEKMRTESELIDLYNEKVYKDLEVYIKKFISMFNNSINNIFKVWELYFVCKGIIEKNPIYVVYDKKKYIKSVEQGKSYIKTYFEMPSKNKALTEIIRNFVRNIIVDLFDEYYLQPFANLDYGYAITVDKSQGSTFDNVFIDAPDILDQNKYPFLNLRTAKQRFYTALTRAAKEINILI
jgi:hypothetical protein